MDAFASFAQMMGGAQMPTSAPSSSQLDGNILDGLKQAESVRTQTAKESEELKQKTNQLWQMLDEMAENDPTAYASFMKNQLEGGKEYLKDKDVQAMFKQMGVDPADAAEVGKEGGKAGKGMPFAGGFDPPPPPPPRRKGPAVVELAVPVMSIFTPIISVPTSLQAKKAKHLFINLMEDSNIKAMKKVKSGGYQIEQSISSLRVQDGEVAVDAHFGEDAMRAAKNDINFVRHIADMTCRNLEGKNRDFKVSRSFQMYNGKCFGPTPLQREEEKDREYEKEKKRYEEALKRRAEARKKEEEERKKRAGEKERDEMEGREKGEEKLGEVKFRLDDSGEEEEPSLLVHEQKAGGKKKGLIQVIGEEEEEAESANDVSEEKARKNGGSTTNSNSRGVGKSAWRVTRGHFCFPHSVHESKDSRTGKKKVVVKVALPLEVVEEEKDMLVAEVVDAFTLIVSNQALGAAEIIHLPFAIDPATARATLRLSYLILTISALSRSGEDIFDDV